MLIQMMRKMSLLALSLMYSKYVTFLIILKICATSHIKLFCNLKKYIMWKILLLLRIFNGNKFLEYIDFKRQWFLRHTFQMWECTTLLSCTYQSRYMEEVLYRTFSWSHIHFTWKLILCRWQTCWTVGVAVCCHTLLVTLVCVWCCTDQRLVLHLKNHIFFLHRIDSLQYECPVSGCY